MAMKWRNVENPKADAFSLAMISVSLTITIIIGIVIGKKTVNKTITKVFTSLAVLPRQTP